MTAETTDTHDEIAALIDDYVLGLLNESEQAQCKTHIDECEACRSAVRTVDALQGVSAMAAPAPPPSLRSNVLQAAFAARSPRSGSSRPELAAWEAETMRLVELARGLAVEFGSERPQPDSVWNRTCIASFDLGVRDVLCHIIATLGVWSSKLDDGIAAPERDQSNIVARTREVIDRHRHLAVSETIAELETAYTNVWRQLDALRTVAAVSNSGMVPGFTIDAYTALLALETWTHADDIRIALDRNGTPPETPHLSTMTQVLPQWLGLVLRSTTSGPARHFRLDLTGRAPAEYDFIVGASGDISGESTPDVTITCDVVEFCKLAGSRRNAETLDYTAIGEIELARTLVNTMADLAVM